LNEKILEMKGISKSFPGVQALADVDIDLHRGEILAICGENGAGKSTLMNILSGSYGHGDFSGEIWVDGHPVKFQSTSDARKVGIEMIYQEISLHLDLSVAENLQLGTLPRTRFGFIDWPRIRREAREALALVGLNLDVATTVRRLSTSQQQLLTIARALIRMVARKTPHSTAESLYFAPNAMARSWVLSPISANRISRKDGISASMRPLYQKIVFWQ